MNAKMCKRVLLLLATSIVTLIFTRDAFSQTSGCNYYASPNGSGNGLTQSTPFQINSFWSVGSLPGKTLCLMNGTYTGANSMITPPGNLNGASGSPITIKALNDGGALISGSNTRAPIQLINNDWFIIEGLNACCASQGDSQIGGEVVKLGVGADNNIIRRLVAWNANNFLGGNEIFLINDNTGNLLEDVAGFGTGRKTFSWYQNPGVPPAQRGTLTIRRAWGRWEEQRGIGPKMVYSLAYNSSNAIFENVIGTWDDTPMGATAVNQPYTIFGADGQSGQGAGICVNSKYLGAIAYIRAVDRVTDYCPNCVLALGEGDCLTVENTVMYVEPGSHTNVSTAYFWPDPTGSQKVVQNTTQIGGAPPTMGSRWTYSNNVDVDTVGAAPNIWNGGGSTGARVCYRYQNGTLTSTPLWPWPMNQRIIAAMTAAGKSPVDVTATMEQIFGTIPTQCKGSDVAPPPPPPPPPPPIVSGSLSSLKTLSPITIDGSLNESVWSLANSVTFSNPTQSDNTVKVSTLWDNTNLYFAYDVTDATKEALNNPAYLWHDDGAEIFLDTQYNKSTIMDGNDYTFRTNINDLVDLPGVTVKTLLKTTGYTQEIQIPWSVISTVPSAGKVLGLLLGNNDRDNGISAQFDWLNIISTGNYSQPNLWGSLALSGTTVGISVPTPPESLVVSVQ